MLYRITKPFATVALKIFFRKIYFSNPEHVPNDKPIILAVNHPTAFIEPCLLACFLPRPLHYLVRGDLFNKPLHRKILMALHMVPIFRFVDGYKNLKQNHDTLEFCYRALNEDKALMILTEGTTKQTKRLRPLQKGAARIVFRCLEKHEDKDIQIIPVGVNYTYADRFRSEVMISFGPSIRVKDYVDLYEENSVKAISVLTEEIAKGMKEQMIHLDKKEDDDLLEMLLVLYRNNQTINVFPVLSSARNRLEAEMSIATKLNELPSQEKQVIQGQCKKYFEELKALGIVDFALHHKGYDAPKNSLILAIGFIPFLIGYGLNYPPIALGKYVKENKVKQLEFQAAVGIVVALVACILYYLLLLLLAILIHPILIGLVFLLPFLGYFSLWYSELYQKYKAAKNFKKLSEKQQKALRETRAMIPRFH